MKGKIDKDGYLWIERGGVMKFQLCPYKITKHKIRNQIDISETPCGDWCPLFGEPVYIDIMTRGFDANELGRYYLPLCNGNEIYSDTLTDERGK